MQPTPAELLAAARRGLAAAPPTPSPPTDGAFAARVRIWREGVEQAAGEASAADALAAVESAAALIEAPDAQGATLWVEAMGEVEPTQPDGLSGLIHAAMPGLHGLRLRDGEQVAVGWPSDALREPGRGAAWAKRLNREARPPGARLAKSTAVERFTTVEAVGPVMPAEDEGDPPRRIAGFRVVEQEEVLPDRLAGAALQAAAWLFRHQRDDGLFAYEYNPAMRGWSNADNLVRQAGCAWAAAFVARLTRDRNTLHAAGRAVTCIAEQHLRRDGPGRLFYLADSDAPRLGAIPLFVLAALELEGMATMDREIVRQLTATMLAVQEPSGRFGTTARGLELEGSETYYAGQLALALARLHASRTFGKPRQRIADAVNRALAHYSERWQKESERDLSFTTWMIQACNAWHAQTPNEQTEQYAYQMADWAIQYQHPQPDPPPARPAADEETAQPGLTADLEAETGHQHPLWQGAYQGTPGIGTAAYTEGIAAALAIAQRTENTEQAAKYEQSTKTAARFLLQLQQSPQDAQLTTNPDHIGAPQSALHRQTLRCDNAQHFLMSLLATRALCWPV